MSKSLSGNLKLNYSSDAFLGTAVYYVHYRIPYPKVLLDDLIKRSNLSPDGKLLDIACGPGRIAIPLAPHFTQVLANDAEPEMINAGKREAGKAGIKNIEWILGKAEKLKLKFNSIDLITIGEAFHRLVQSLILKLALGWLKTAGHIAIIGCNSIFRGNEPWHKAVYEIVHKWTSLVHRMRVNLRKEEKEEKQNNTSLFWKKMDLKNAIHIHLPFRFTGQLNQ